MTISHAAHFSSKTPFRKMNEYGQEAWSARDLMPPLGYARWENFEEAISRAKVSCTKSKQTIDDHFRDTTKMIKIGTGTEKEAEREVNNPASRLRA